MQHGGARKGAGRKKGALTVKTQTTAERALGDGKSPLDVMLENMRHFQQVAIDAEATIANMSVAEISGQDLSPDEQFKLLLAKAKQAASLRQMACECARDAASYIHPKLASITHGGSIALNSHEVALAALDNFDAADIGEPAQTAH